MQIRKPSSAPSFDANQAGGVFLGGGRIGGMKALAVFLNGKQVCIAAPHEYDGLYAQAELRNDPESDGRKDDLAVWGRIDNQVAYWAYSELVMGDEIVIRVVDADNLSQPVRYSPVLPENRR